jgi:aryl-alcohol dehydrogenase-like predicted oxidoreductase
VSFGGQSSSAKGGRRDVIRRKKWLLLSRWKNLARNQRGVLNRVALAWLRRNPVVAAPIVGALKTSHIDEAIRGALDTASISLITFGLLSNGEAFRATRTFSAKHKR